MILETIHGPDDVKALSASELPKLAEELREEVLRVVSKNGGHLSSNLGVVELTLALHRVFDSPNDKLIFDVGHQSYIHKLLTGRQDIFENLRRMGGASGFTRRDESVHDPFGSGHSSNAISAALGFASAMKLTGDTHYAVAVVGDGAFTGGMVYEALNNCTDRDLRLIIILNDNEMSISKNVGSLDNYFSRFRTSRRYFRFKHAFVSFFSALPLIGGSLVRGARRLKNWLKRVFVQENFFELLGLDYIGPVDGADLPRLINVMEEAKKSSRICVVHVCTHKGNGYGYAEKQPDLYHSVGHFDLQTGVVPNGKEETYSYQFGQRLAECGARDPAVCAVTAAMCGGTGMSEFASRFPERFFDVGIAEEHAVTFCAGLAAAGKKPVFAVYATFLQRAYDQILEDAAIQSLPVVLAIDRAGIVGDDGVTHHGLFDVALLSAIPGMTLYAPDGTDELGPCLEACLKCASISAFRYPKGKPVSYPRAAFSGEDDILATAVAHPDAAIVTYGRLTANAVEAAALLQERGISAKVIRLRRLKPIAWESVFAATAGAPRVLFAEEGIRTGGIGEQFGNWLAEHAEKTGYHINAVDDRFLLTGTNDELFDQAGLSPRKLADAVSAMKTPAAER